MRKLLGIGLVAAFAAGTLLALTAAPAFGNHVQCGDTITQDTTLDCDLSEKYGKRYKKRTFAQSCERRSRTRFRCFVSWVRKGQTWAGTVTVWNTVDFLEYSVHVRKFPAP
jgi:hypothetical protein